MFVWRWLAGEDTMTKNLRRYSAKNVKFSEADMTLSRQLVKEYVEEQIMEYCRMKSSLTILRLEYTGSVYERLKTEAPDEVDVMVVLKTSSPWLWGDPEVMVEGSDEVTGFVRLKAREDSKLRDYADSDGNISSQRLLDRWWYSLVVRAVNDYKKSCRNSDIEMVVRYHRPAVQLDITKNGTSETTLSVDLVPCFQAGSDQNYYVAKPYRGRRYVSDPDLLWRQSFSLEEKALLRDMDRDGGCRHELFRIVKTIINRERSSLGQLESYHLKTAFMHYMKENPSDWNNYSSLGRHFHGFLQHLQGFLQKGNLPHYWLPGINLLEDINSVVVNNMACRIKRILNSETVMNEILE